MEQKTKDDGLYFASQVFQILIHICKLHIRRLFVLGSLLNERLYSFNFCAIASCSLQKNWGRVTLSFADFMYHNETHWQNSILSFHVQRQQGRSMEIQRKKQFHRKDAVISWLVCSFFSLQDCNEKSWDSPGPKFFLVKIEDCLWYHMLTTCRKPLMQYQGNFSQETFKPRLYP